MFLDQRGESGAGETARKTGLASLVATVERDEAIGRVKASVYGLQASIITRDLTAALRANQAERDGAGWAAVRDEGNDGAEVDLLAG